MTDKYKQQFAQTAAEAFRALWPEVYKATGDSEVFSAPFILTRLEKPKDPSMGRFAFPVFRFARLLKSKPPDIAASVARHINESLQEQPDKLITCSSVVGFINTSVEFTALAKDTLEQILSESNKYGSQDLGQNRKMLVEYCSANIAKPFGIGHLRSTIIGNSLRRVFAKLNFDVVGINYLGDWGTQFGKMIVAHQLWGKNLEFESEKADSTPGAATRDVKKLLDLYVKFHHEAESNPELNDKAREAFKKLEEGDVEATKLWDQFKNISQAEFDRIFEILGIEFDFVTGESFLNDKMDAVINRFEKAGLTSISQSALIVDLEDPQLPPLLLRKADGATLYATRDLAGLIYRWETYRFHESLYVVASQQLDHFKQAFKAIAMLEEAEGLPEEDRMTGRVRHVNFGWVMFENQILSTRRGDIIFLEEVIDQAVDLAAKLIREKNPDLADLDNTAQLIGVGAVIFSQLSVRKHKDVNFNWEEVLNFEGETGPYLQYTHARLCSLLRSYGKQPQVDIDVALLNNIQEQRVIELLADFPETVAATGAAYDPHVISSYLLRLAASFNKFYQRKNDDGKSDKILSDNSDLTAARMALVLSVQIVLNEGLYLLGIKAPQEM